MKPGIPFSRVWRWLLAPLAARGSGGVFISYRRTSGDALSDERARGRARSLKEFLRSAGYRVFLDVDNLGAGRFENQILPEVRRHLHFVVLLTPGVFVRRDGGGDYMEDELKEALKTGRNIVPVSTEWIDFEAEKRGCPDSLKDLFQYQSPPLRESTFEQDASHLVSRFLKRQYAKWATAIALPIAAFLTVYAVSVQDSGSTLRFQLWTDADPSSWHSDIVRLCTNGVHPLAAFPEGFRSWTNGWRERGLTDADFASVVSRPGGRTRAGQVIRVARSLDALVAVTRLEHRDGAWRIAERLQTVHWQVALNPGIEASDRLLVFLFPRTTNDLNRIRAVGDPSRLFWIGPADGRERNLSP